MVGRDRELDKRLVAVLDNLLATIDKDNLLARENRQLTMVSALLLSTAVTSQGTNLLVWAFCNIYNAIFERRAAQGKCSVDLDRVTSNLEAACGWGTRLTKS